MAHDIAFSMGRTSIRFCSCGECCMVCCNKHGQRWACATAMPACGTSTAHHAHQQPAHRTGLALCTTACLLNTSLLLVLSAAVEWRGSGAFLMVHCNRCPSKGPLRRG